MSKKAWALALFAFSLGLFLGCTRGTNSAPDPDPLTEVRPIDGVDTVWLEEMTWMEVRDAIQEGQTTVIVATGGIEQNGPFVALGKHNYILEVTCERIARELGQTMVAPIIRYVPEGSYAPPQGHMRYPGTLGVSSRTFQSMLKEIASCLRVHGFKEIIFLGDSGDNQADMHFVSQELNQKWDDCRVHYIPEYYDYPRVREWLRTQGVEEKMEGYHDEVAFSAQVSLYSPQAIRTEQRLKKGLFKINGFDLVSSEKVNELGEGIVKLRVEQSVAAIRDSLKSESP